MILLAHLKTQDATLRNLNIIKARGNLVTIVEICLSKLFSCRARPLEMSQWEEAKRRHLEKNAMWMNLRSLTTRSVWNLDKKIWNFIQSPPNVLARFRRFMVSRKFSHSLAMKIYANRKKYWTRMFFVSFLWVDRSREDLRAQQLELNRRWQKYSAIFPSAFPFISYNEAISGSDGQRRRKTALEAV